MQFYILFLLSKSKPNQEKTKNFIQFKFLLVLTYKLHGCFSALYVFVASLTQTGQKDPPRSHQQYNLVSLNHQFWMLTLPIKQHREHVNKDLTSNAIIGCPCCLQSFSTTYANPYVSLLNHPHIISTIPNGQSSVVA